MDLTLPDGLRGRLLALALTITLLATLALGCVQPLIGWYFDRATELDRQNALVRRMTALVAAIPDLRRQASAARPASGELLGGGSDALAGAALQNTIQNMATQAGTDLTSLETLPAEARGAYRRIALRISLSAPWPALIELLQEIEQHTPGMLLDNMQLRVSPSQARSAASPVNANFTVIGFRAGSAGGGQ
jgi:general secretion pathway protein M